MMNEGIRNKGYTLKGTGHYWETWNVNLKIEKAFFFIFMEKGNKPIYFCVAKEQVRSGRPQVCSM